MYAVLRSEFCLFPHNVGSAQVIEPELARQLGLQMPGKAGLCPRDVSPFGEALAPSLVVEWNRMKLRQIECDHLYIRRCGGKSLLHVSGRRPDRTQVRLWLGFPRKIPRDRPPHLY